MPNIIKVGIPIFFEQDVFRTSVEFENTTIKAADATINATISDTDATIKATISEEDLQMLRLIQAKPDITYTELSEQLDLHRATVARRIKNLAEKRVISRVGARKTGVWKINISLQNKNV